MTALIEPMVTQNCWICSNCHAKYDALWRLTAKPFIPLACHNWVLDPPPFKYCPNCGAKIERKYGDKD